MSDEPTRRRSDQRQPRVQGETGPGQRPAGHPGYEPSDEPASRSDQPQPQAQADEGQPDPRPEGHPGYEPHQEAPTAPPAVVDVPAVSPGTAGVGDTLTCTMGNWDGEPASYSYQWKSDGAADLGTGDTYVVAASDSGHSITCIVTATNDLGSTEAPPSNAVAIP
jgi:hypothetical protein